jgi:seryl-tRNA synthetase
MLDLNYVRENLDAVKSALSSRNFDAGILDKFSELDATRRQIISEADAVNQSRNAASKVIGDLIKAGNRDEADVKKAEVADLKTKQSDLEAKRDEAEAAMHDLLAGLPNIPADDVPVGVDERANVEIRKWGEPPNSISSPKIMSTLGIAWHSRSGTCDKDRRFKVCDIERCRCSIEPSSREFYA